MNTYGPANAGDNVQGIIYDVDEVDLLKSVDEVKPSTINIYDEVDLSSTSTEVEMEYTSKHFYAIVLETNDKTTKG